MAKKTPRGFRDENQGGFSDEAPEVSPVIEIKISDDDGETWDRKRVDASQELAEWGLRAGQLVIVNSEKYWVVADEFGEIGLEKAEPRKRR